MSYEQPPLFNVSGGQAVTLESRSRQKKKNSHALLFLSLALIMLGLGLGLGGVLFGTGVFQSANNDVRVNVGSSENVSTSIENFSDVVDVALPSVVTVGMRADSGVGTGSGVVLDSDKGYVVTNAHVVQPPSGATAEGIVVRTSTGETYDASVVGVDVLSDIAVIQVEEGLANTRSVTFAEKSVTTGDTTIAIGSPLGLAGTVTTGVVSAINRPVSLMSAEGEPLSINAIQTDASINSGNSGGGLFDNSGNLIGINVAISSTENNTGSIGIGYAIPATHVLRSVTELIETGSASHVTLGVNVGDSVDESGIFSIGAVVGDVNPDSAAADAGLVSGDVIISFDGTRIESATQLVAMVRQVAPGEEVSVTIRSIDMETKDLQVQL